MKQPLRAIAATVAALMTGSSVQAQALPSLRDWTR